MAVQLREVPSNRWGAQSRGVAFLELRWLPPLRNNLILETLGCNWTMGCTTDMLGVAPKWQHLNAAKGLPSDAAY